MGCATRRANAAAWPPSRKHYVPRDTTRFLSKTPCEKHQQFRNVHDDVAPCVKKNVAAFVAFLAKRGAIRRSVRPRWWRCGPPLPLL